MRKFNVTVNGKTYSVEVEETGASAPVAAPAAAPAATAAAPAPAAPAGGTPVKSPMPGVVRKLAFVNGAAVKAGQPVVVLEAMKMENDIVATADGVITYAVEVGANVETDAVLAYIK
ncbi:MAG TPA: acetyl-CoA carboxylase biotin carboxyl carrier protein subunit [Candidatus Protoclostridium stercorigallinarum]|uniref:Acetyl-CoA carboxylase biotin carboxyl carrier protein subunit n=1 Tax=Candidatus Protoclostridium stercorigallinarum TaxID=2838741 RepID=A0A9D1Q0F7_9FIRM|nr:acetyl-CoA carboxylase biotin carboxyl carrier protein subunit [Candidatus Protoclostridium stercorigallinarum]